MKLVSWIAGVASALVLVLFAVSNRGTVSLGIEPLPFTLELPLYGAVFASLILGFVLGGLGAWIAGRHARRRARRAEAEAKRLRAELAATPAPTQDAASRPTALPTHPGNG